MNDKFGITVLGSGSRGNSTVIHGPEGSLLVDAGFSAREIDSRLSACHIDPDCIQAVLITHGHSDHVKGCRVFANRHHIRAYFTAPTLQEGSRCHFLPDLQSIISPGTPFDLCGVHIEPFTLPHDAVDTVGYTFQALGHKIGVATDLGHLNILAMQKLHGCSILMLESNHDPSLLQASGRPIQTIRRILGRHGHLSNADAMLSLRDLLTEESTSLILAHLSSECNTRDLVEGIAEETLNGLGRGDIDLEIARQDAPLSTIWVTE